MEEGFVIAQTTW